LAISNKQAAIDQVAPSLQDKSTSLSIEQKLSYLR